MILLRCISFLIGSLIVMGAPFFLLPDAPVRPGDVGMVIGACFAIALVSSGFFIIGVAGNHMKRSPKTRKLAGALLAVPILGSMGILLLGRSSDDIWMVGPVMCGAIFLFIVFVYPARRRRTHRAMRPRDPEALPASVN
jgi:hypothetical protein